MISHAFSSSPPVALTIAGSDSSAGAGIQADLKVFSRHGVYGLTAVTCIVAEVPGQVASIQAVDVAVVSDQIALSLAHFSVRAMKTGMLFSPEIAAEVVRMLRREGAGIPLVVDPVMVASSGDRLLQEAAVDIYKSDLLPMATLVTPNLDEAAMLLGCAPISSVAEMEAAGKCLSALYRTAFLMKGGHLLGGSAVDLLVSGDSVEVFEAPFLRESASHGTGCTYSAAIVAELAHGASLRESVARAKAYITATLRESLRWEKNGGHMRALHLFPAEGGMQEGLRREGLLGKSLRHENEQNRHGENDKGDE